MTKKIENEIAIKRKNTYSMKIKSLGKDSIISITKKEKKLYTKEEDTKKIEQINTLTNNTNTKLDKKKIENLEKNNKNKTEHTILRAPIVTIIGHVDHGKTTLLNYIINPKNSILEHRGITQHINIHETKYKNEKIIFLDTPGHFAFNSTRQRGIQNADIAILVIAIDDGIMPQTIEAINLAKNNNIPIIVAINKIDKSIDKNEKLITELLKYNLIPEKWGGDTLFSFISAKTGAGINDLLENINLQAEMLNLKTTNTGNAEGIVIDSKLDQGKGYITTIIITKGHLKKGDIGTISSQCGKIKSITDIKTKTPLNEVYPTTPIEITGITGPINITEKFKVITNEKQIKNIIEHKNEKLNNKNEYHIEDLILKMKKIKKNKINLIIKTDVQGSIDVIKNSINDLSTEDTEINIIKAEIGKTNQSDIDLSITTNSSIINFNLKLDSEIKKISKKENIKIKTFNTIYEILDYIKDIINTKLTTQEEENVLGTAEVRKIFEYEKTKIIAGCYITQGKIKKTSQVKIYRDNNLIHKGFIDSIKIFKTTVNEVKLGDDCGIIIKNFNNLQINDTIKSFF